MKPRQARVLLHEVVADVPLRRPMTRLACIQAAAVAHISNLEGIVRRIEGTRSDAAEALRRLQESTRIDGAVDAGMRRAQPNAPARGEWSRHIQNAAKDSDDARMLIEQVDQLLLRVRAFATELVDDLIAESAIVRTTLRGEYSQWLDVQLEVDELNRRLGRCARGEPIVEHRPLFRKSFLTLMKIAVARGEAELARAGKGRQRSRAGPAITQKDTAHALMALHDGTAQSQRDLAALLGVSQSTVSRHPILRKALKATGERSPRRGYRTTDGGLEAVDDAES